MLSIISKRIFGPTNLTLSIEQPLFWALLLSKPLSPLIDSFTVFTVSTTIIHELYRPLHEQVCKSIFNSCIIQTYRHSLCVLIFGQSSTLMICSTIPNFNLLVNQNAVCHYGQVKKKNFFSRLFFYRKESMQELFH